MFESKSFRIWLHKFLYVEVPGNLMGDNYRTEIMTHDEKIFSGMKEMHLLHFTETYPAQLPYCITFHHIEKCF